MPKPYSSDLRARVIEAVEAGASRREAAESFQVSPSTAIKWLKRWEKTGSKEAKPTGGSTSPLDEQADLVLEFIEHQSDLTLTEMAKALGRRRIATSRSSLWRFLERHGITFKKNLAGDRARPR